MIPRLLAVTAICIVISPATAGADPPSTADLTIRAEGADYEYRSFTEPFGFVVRDGQKFTFQNLVPGTYVVLQAPPGVFFSWGCSNGDQPDRVSLEAGDKVVCTFTATG